MFGPKKVSTPPLHHSTGASSTKKVSTPPFRHSTGTSSYLASKLSDWSRSPTSSPTENPRSRSGSVSSVASCDSLATEFAPSKAQSGPIYRTEKDIQPEQLKAVFLRVKEDLRWRTIFETPFDHDDEIFVFCDQQWCHHSELLNVEMALTRSGSLYILVRIHPAIAGMK